MYNNVTTRCELYCILKSSNKIQIFSMVNNIYCKVQCTNKKILAK